LEGGVLATVSRGPLNAGKRMIASSGVTVMTLTRGGLSVFNKYSLK
jgi:hypothetical protein